MKPKLKTAEMASHSARVPVTDCPAERLHGEELPQPNAGKGRAQNREGESGGIAW
jgi:hypothetical protein